MITVLFILYAFAMPHVSFAGSYLLRVLKVRKIEEHLACRVAVVQAGLGPVTLERLAHRTTLKGLLRILVQALSVFL